MIDGDMQEFSLTLDKFLRHAAKWHPQAEVVSKSSDGNTNRINYAALMQQALRVTHALKSMGVELGDRVATLAWNTQAHVETWYGIMGMGAVCHTLNPRLTAETLSSMIEQSAAKILIVSADLLPIAQEIIENNERQFRILIIDGDPKSKSEPSDKITLSTSLLSEFMDKASTLDEWGQFEERQPAGLCFTSGTTGAPKGVTYLHRSNYLHTLRLLQADALALRQIDSVLAVVPMFHANAWGLPFAAPCVGAKLVLPGRHTDGESLANLIRSEDVTIAVGVPTVWLALLEHVESHDLELPSLRRIVTGGASMPPALMARLEKRLGVTVQTSWGMTELSPGGTFAVLDDPNRKAHLSGKPAIGIDLILKNASGETLPQQRNVEGHLYCRWNAVISRYYGQSFLATDDEGWFATGDLAKITRNGDLEITGRSKDLIKSGGEWINPATIETLVSACSDVALAAVIGREDQRWGERPVLIVEMKDQTPTSDESLLLPLRENLSSWWIPDEIIRLNIMPLAPTGKIDKNRLRHDYGAC